ncbi:MAG: hypothetical protein ACRBK7_14120 [Acidimicrobiales bacterium]
MAALVTSTLVGILMTVGILAYAKRRPVGTPVTWGEAMIGSTYVFFLAFLAYGVIPHQWLTLAENEWSFRADRIMFGKGDIIKPISQGGWFPVDITYQAISDTVAVLFYVVFLGMQIWLWAAWQNRDKTAESKAKAALSQTSSFGRPLIKQG